MKKILLFIVFSLSTATAFASSSPNYAILTDAFANGGSVGTKSTNYIIDDIIAQDLLIGKSNSANYNISAGRYGSMESKKLQSPVITTNGGIDFKQKFLNITLEGTSHSLTYYLYVNSSGVGVMGYSPGDTTWKYKGLLNSGANSFSVTALDSLKNESEPDTITVTLDTKTDDDTDTLPTYWEEQFGLSWTDSTGLNGKDGDPDNDGQTNYQEYMADTNPLDGSSILKITKLEEVPSVGFKVEFPTSTRRTYRIYFSDEPYSDTMKWTPLVKTISGTGTNITWIDDGSGTSISPLDNSVLHRYYKITAEISIGWQ